MIKFRAVMIAAGLALSTAAVTPPASAELWSWAKCGADASDFDAIKPVVDKLLSEDRVGATRAWSSPAGSSGHVRLVAGGEKAGSNEGRVRITKIVEGREKTLFTFKYRKVPGKGWGTCG